MWNTICRKTGVLLFLDLQKSSSAVRKFSMVVKICYKISDRYMEIISCHMCMLHLWKDWIHLLESKLPTCNMCNVCDWKLSWSQKSEGLDYNFLFLFHFTSSSAQVLNDVQGVLVIWPKLWLESWSLSDMVISSCDQTWFYEHFIVVITWITSSLNKSSCPHWLYLSKACLGRLQIMTLWL